MPPLPALLLAALAALTGCRAPEAPARAELVVFAASSLTEAMHALEAGFEATHPDIDVRPTFAGSQVLRLQIEQGAVAHVYASADEAHMQALVTAGRVTDAHPFARNTLVAITPADSDLATFADLARAERLVIGAESVPVGRYTRAVLTRAEATHGEAFVRTLRAHVASHETNVRLVRAKVELGEADAAFVYRTDAPLDAPGARVRAIELPPALQIDARYPIGRVEGAPPAAAAFIAYVRSPAGQAVLAERGFSPATP